MGMWDERIQDLFWLAAGGHIVAVGGAQAVLSAFQGSFLGTYAGIVLFIVGYKLSWYGLHRGRKEELKAEIDWMSNTEATRLAREVVLFTTGAAGIALGIYLFAQSATGSLPLLGYAAGAVSFGSYLIAHKQMNRVLI